MAEPAQAAGADLAPLGRRLGLLQVLRLGLVVVVSAAAVVAPGPLGGHPAAPLVAVSALYAAISATAEVLRRRSRWSGPAGLGGTVLLDGVYLAAVTAMTGGPRSVLYFLVLVHVIAVTLLLSFRSGLKTALWHALLLFVVVSLQEAGVVDARAVVAEGEAAVLAAVALLVVAAATAWFSSLNEGELRRGTAELRAMAAMASRMAAAGRADELVHALLVAVADGFGFPRGAVLVSGGEGARAMVRGDDGRLDEAATGPACDAVAARCWLGGAPVLVGALDRRADALLSRALPGAANVVVLPLVADGQVLGALAVERGGRPGSRIGSRTVSALGQFAAHAALALRAAELQAEVERLAGTDALTGLANRRVFQESLARELALAARRGDTCSLVLLDVDHFKAINDAHGHQAGDEVLRQVGQALADVGRGTDVAARYGGEEFAVVLPSCPPDEALVVAERLRAAIAARHRPVAVTASAGVACFPDDAVDEDGLVGAADAALYQAKRAGRDRSVRARRGPDRGGLAAPRRSPAAA